MTSTLANYAALLAKVDAKFAEIRTRNAARMQCRLGCHGCCRPGLTVSPIEAEAIRAYLAARPALSQSLVEQERNDPHSGARCAFLGADGACGIYEARPLVCRSHGVPIAFRIDEGAEVRRDVCPLNFAELPLEEIDQGDVLNLELINSILALINAQHAGRAGQARVALTPRALTAGVSAKSDR